MNGKQLKNSILQWAIQGRLVPQDPTDEPASQLLQRIQAEKAKLVKEGKLKKSALSDSHIFRGEDNKYYEKVGKTITCIDEDIPFEIPETWEWVRLGSIVNIFSGATFKKDETNKEKRGIRIMRGGNILPFKLLTKDDDIYLDSEKVNPAIFLKQNDLITPAVTSLENIGKIARCDVCMNNTAVGGFVFTIRQYVDSATTSKYLLYIISAPSFVKGIKSITNKSGQAFYNIGKEKMANLLLPLPPLPEQHRIVAKLEEVLSVVERYEKAQDALDALCNSLDGRLRKSILSEAIQGHLVPQDPTDEPASVLLQRIQAEKARLVKEGKLKKSALNDSHIFRGEDNKYYEKVGKTITCIDEDIPFEIPKTWEWVKIGTVFAHNNGKQLNKSNSKGKLMEYITTSNLYWDGFKLEGLKKMPYEEHEIERCQALKGDLLVCEGGDVGRSCIWPYNTPIMLQNHIHKLRAYYPVCTKYFFYVLYEFNLSGRIGGKGIGIQGFSSNALHNTNIPLPPLPEQHRIVAEVEELFAVLDRLASR